MSNLSERSAAIFEAAQARIAEAIEELDGGAAFRKDHWQRSSGSSTPGIGFGGGLTAVLEGGKIFEKAGVNFSKVEGLLPSGLAGSLTGSAAETPFFATGVSLVIHPRSPQVPTVHANYRFLRAGGKEWFGGGADLTPYVLFEEDAMHFHRTHKLICERHHPDFYERFKRQCDEYFYLPHRKETRGIGGIFFDYMGREEPALLETMSALTEELAAGFLDAYLPIVRRRFGLPSSEREKRFQLLRRGRYAEFNLLYDRGTQFGLQTSGRIESILMSLPPLAAWEYDVVFPPGSAEEKLLNVLRTPREWA